MPAHQSHQLGRDRETQTGAPEHARRRVIRLREFLEDQTLLVRGEANAGIAYLKMQSDDRWIGDCDRIGLHCLYT